MSANLRRALRHRLPGGPRSPADYEAWKARDKSADQGFPKDWANVGDFSVRSRAHVAAVVHAFYPELLDEIVGQLAAIPVAFDLIVTNATGAELAVDPSRLPHVVRLHILEVENRGRDLWPLVQVVNAGLLDGCDLVIKVHTKRSDWRAEHRELRGSGQDWRAGLLGALLGDAGNVEAILSAFERHPDLGMVTADGSVLGPEFWGQDEPVTAELLRRLDLRLRATDLVFAAGSMYWARTRVLRRLRDLRMSAADFEPEQGQVDGTTAHALERVIGVLVRGDGLRILERSALTPGLACLPWSTGAPAASALTPQPPGLPGSPAVVAFHLPQYHRVPENDAWWGEGFTDWRNVAAARPMYPGHAIPDIPADLGEYDLLSQDVRAAQADLARQYGVYGFCYYFYWFGGRRLLERPIELMLEDGQPELPFCLCWANEPWTRRWDGREDDVLMAQDHDRVRDLAILDDLMPYFGDPRYIRVEGRPLLLVYRQGLMPDAAGFVTDLRGEAVRRGLPGLFVCNVLSIGDVERVAKGFDAAVEFPPQGTLGVELDRRRLVADPAFRGHVYDYTSTVQTAIARPTPSYPHFPGVMPRWDNTARKRTAAHIFHGSTPELFERWLRRAAMVTAQRNPRAPLVFVNSWNEWAEGAHLEPDERTGRRYLEAVRRVMTLAATEPQVRWAGSRSSDSNGGLAEPAGACTVTSIRPGMPPGASNLTVVDGAAWIDEVEGRTLVDYVIPVTGGQVVSVRGWCYGGAPQRGFRMRGGYLVLSSGPSVWHAPLGARHGRPDLLRAILGRSRARRRIVRAIDRVPWPIGSRLLQSWWRSSTRFGFDVCVRIAGPPPGQYRIGILEVTGRGPLLTPTDCSLVIAQQGATDVQA